MDAADRSDPIACAVATFRQRYERGVTFREDRDHAVELSAEVVPVMRVLLAPGSLQAPDQLCAESGALVHLLGYRAAALGATPTAALLLARSLGAALHEATQEQAPSLNDLLAAIVLEGYTAGRDERWQSLLGERLKRSQVWLELAPGLFAVFLGPLAEPCALAQLLSEVAKQLLRQGAGVCLLDASRMVTADSDCLRELGEFVATCASLGVRVFALGLDGASQQQLQRMVQEGALSWWPDFAQALSAGLSEVGLSLKRRGIFGG